MTIQDKVVWEDGERRLYFDGDVLKLRYKGEDYTFSSHGYEPMAIILKGGTAVAYIHNSFIVEDVCKAFIENPKYLCHTITGHNYNAKHFCMLLTIALDYGFEWDIDSLEMKLRFQEREVWYSADGIEFGKYADEIDDSIDPAEFDDEDDTQCVYDIIYIVVDGKEYHLKDATMDKMNQLGIFEPGRRKPKIRINGTKGSVIAAYAADWRSGNTFTPFGFPCNTKQFCDMIAYVIRDGRNCYEMSTLRKTLFYQYNKNT